MGENFFGTLMDDRTSAPASTSWRCEPQLKIDVTDMTIFKNVMAMESLDQTNSSIDIKDAGWKQLSAIAGNFSDSGNATLLMGIDNVWVRVQP